jgi:hypothetical protein
MKRKLKLLMQYFRSAGLDKVNFNIDVQDNSVEYEEIDVDFSVATPIKNIFDEIIELHVDQIVDEGESEINEDETSDYYQIYGTIYLKKQIIKFEKFNYTYYGVEESGTSYDISDYSEGDSMYNNFIDVDKILKELNINEMIVGYDGGGDSGYINSDYRTEDGKTGDTPAVIEDICYDLLEDYGGWEINEGSSGTFIFTKNTIDHEHLWRTEENDSVSLDIEVNENSFDE